MQLLTGRIHKRRDGGDDVTSSLIRHRDATDALTEQEPMDSLLLRTGAGHETTVNLLDHAVTLLLGHPERLALLRSGAVRGRTKPWWPRSRCALALSCNRRKSERFL